jgi:serine/threonine-protein kinase
VEKAERQGEPTRLGSYEVVRKLARGGMADLFLARTVTNTFERLVVVKKILPKFAVSPRYVQLFLDEAKLAAGLNHKNIVQVFDIGNHGADSFFAMEFLHGQDVRTVLHRTWRLNEKMPIKHAIHIASQVAAALHFAHEKRRPDGSLLNIVHRDVSPSNVIVTYDGSVKLLDFGVAKAATSTIKTRTGTLKGKISYMSPEQAKGASVDRRSDVFSLGIVLWEMITTTRLFRGENDLATLQQIINQPPKKPSEVNPECPKELERIVLRALSQDPATRYQTAHELAIELEDLVRQLQLMQSTTALSLYMATLFRPEIASWHEAKAAGVELSEHLTSATGAAELTTPISESEFIEPIDEEDEEELELEDEEPETLRPVAGVIDPGINPMRASKPMIRPALQPHMQGQPPPPTPTSMPAARAGTPLAPPVPRREGGTPPPQLEPRKTPTNPAAAAAPPAAVPTPAPMQRLDITPLPSVMLGRVDPTVSKAPGTAAPEGPNRGPTGAITTPWPAAAGPVSLPGQLHTPEQASRIRKHAMIGGGALFGVILVISIVKGCGAAAPSEKAGEPEIVEPAAVPVDAAPVPEVVTPPVVTVDAGVVEPPIDASEPAVAEPIDAAIADEPPIDAPAIKKPPTRPVIKKPPPVKKVPKQPKGFDPNRPLPRR